MFAGNKATTGRGADGGSGVMLGEGDAGFGEGVDGGCFDDFLSVAT